MKHTITVLSRLMYPAATLATWQKVEDTLSLIADKRFSAQYRINEGLKDAYLFKDINQPEAVQFYKQLWWLIKQVGTKEQKVKLMQAINVANDQKFLQPN